MAGYSLHRRLPESVSDRTDGRSVDRHRIGDWTLPDGTAQTPTFELQHIKTVSRPEGTMLLFAGETSSDDGAYSLALLLI